MNEYHMLAHHCSSMAQGFKAAGLWDLARYWVDQSMHYWRLGNGH